MFLLVFGIVAGEYNYPSHLLLDPGDTRIYRYGASFFNKAVQIHDHSSRVNVYYLDSTPEVEKSPSGKIITHKETIPLTQEEWTHFAYYLNPGSIVTIEMKCTYGSANFFLIKGQTSMNEWEEDGSKNVWVGSRFSSNSASTSLTYRITSSDLYFLVFDNADDYARATIDFSFSLARTQYQLATFKPLCAAGGESGTEQSEMICNVPIEWGDKRIILLQGPDVEEEGGGRGKRRRKLGKTSHSSPSSTPTISPSLSPPSTENPTASSLQLSPSPSSSASETEETAAPTSTSSNKSVVDSVAPSPAPTASSSLPLLSQVEVTFDIDVYNVPRWSGLILLFLSLPLLLVYTCVCLPLTLAWCKNVRDSRAATGGSAGFSFWPFSSSSASNSASSNNNSIYAPLPASELTSLASGSGMGDLDSPGNSGHGISGDFVAQAEVIPVEQAVWAEVDTNALELVNLNSKSAAVGSYTVVAHSTPTPSAPPYRPDSNV